MRSIGSIKLHHQKVSNRGKGHFRSEYFKPLFPALWPVFVSSVYKQSIVHHDLQGHCHELRSVKALYIHLMGDVEHWMC